MYPGPARRVEVTERLQHNPPRPILLLQSRLAALYPDYVIGFMPSDALCDPALSPFVGNAVMPGDAPTWHVDYTPLETPVESMWAAQHGIYPNRQVSRVLEGQKEGEGRLRREGELREGGRGWGEEGDTWGGEERRTREGGGVRGKEGKGNLWEGARNEREEQ